MDHIEKLLIDVKDRLERQIDGVDRRMMDNFADTKTRFDTQSLRLDRHAALLQTGNRWTARANDWSEKVDQEQKDLQIAELTRRIQKLETDHK